MTPLMEQLAALYPLDRALVSDGTDAALELIGATLPEWTVETWAPGEQAWTWRVPERYVVHEAYLETADARRVADSADSPLLVVSYSEPVDALLAFDALEPHLHTAAQRPAAIPYEFKFYERSWGFCLSQDALDALPRDVRYRAVIRSEFVSDPERGLRIGVARAAPRGGHDERAGELLVCAHIDHPAMANDDAAGVVTAAEVARRLAADPLPEGSMSVRFVFCPETIGSVCYLSRHEDLIERLHGAVFSEMTGNDNGLVLQRSRQDDDEIDRIARRVLAARGPVREGAFRTVVCNDELVINGPGVDVPCISISRWPYPEYHTSDDDLSIVSEDRLREAADVIEEIVRIRATSYRPRRTFRGPVFLSGHGLWVDWRVNYKLNRALEKLMLRLEGDHSVFDIAEELELDYWDVHEYVERFRERGLVTR
jgi:aminopeptidase-like protein